MSIWGVAALTAALLMFSFFALLWMVFCFVGMANTKPEEERFLMTVAVGPSALCLLGWVAVVALWVRYFVQLRAGA